jgi:sporulation related protein
MKMSYGWCLISVLGLAGCSSAQSDWQQSNASGTVSAYQEFLQKHPNTPQSVKARERIHALLDEEAWTRAQQINTLQSYQSYIQEQPSGAHLAQAKDNIASSERTTAWLAASTTDTPESLQAFLEKYPEGPEADKAKARLAQLTGFRVQLATCHSERQAEKTRDKLQGKYGDVLGNVVIVPGAGENLHVLQSASMGQGEANNACAKLRRDHLPCEVIKDANS